MFIEELDREFYYAIPKIKCGYVKMYPESKFDGKLLSIGLLNVKEMQFQERQHCFILEEWIQLILCVLT